MQFVCIMIVKIHSSIAKLWHLLSIIVFGQSPNPPAGQGGHPQHLQDIDISQEEVNSEPEREDEKHHKAQSLGVVCVHVKESDPEHLNEEQN